MKKQLTFFVKCSLICAHRFATVLCESKAWAEITRSKRRKSFEKVLQKKLKKFEKTFEKQLTNKSQCDMMYKLSVETARLNDFSRNVV